MNFPLDDDGHVLRRMAEHGFDFTVPAIIDFNIDFDHWPLSDAEMARIRGAFPNAGAIDPDEEDLEMGNQLGYVAFQVRALVTHELVVKIQQRASVLTKDIGGVCESWGVWQK
ncbi:MAG: ribonuclease E inhibitor RraB [Acidobacteria bacterium]|nr:ribonuclease E inhibitor RraB [Acidobacteriota bacterium]MCB9399069.1 ribonuclease E inhibitor RraB [Acidobacteriota bacterium]